MNEKLKRVIARDGITKEKALSRISTQLTDSQLKEKCDYEIDNSENADIEKQILDIIAELKRKF